MDQFVLVADDEASVVKLATRALSRHGFQVLSAGRGDEALELFEKHSSNIILAIVDFSMPAIDGAELIELLHRINPDLKVLLTSGLDLSWFPGDLMTSPNIDFLQKPFRINCLVDKVEELLAFQASSPKKNFNNLVVRSIS